MVGQKSSPTPSTRYGRPEPARVHRSLGIGGHDLDVGVLRLQVSADTRDRAAGAGAGNEVGDPAVGLGPDLGTGGQFVGLGIVGVGVLVRPERSRGLAEHPLGRGVVRRRVVGGDGDGAHDDLTAVGPQQIDLLGCHLVGDDEDAVVAPLGGHDGEPDTGVARRGFDDRPARLQEPVAFRSVDHRDGRPVLDAPPGIGRLDLRHDRGGKPGADPTQANHGGVADQVEYGVCDVHRQTLLSRAGVHGVEPVFGRSSRAELRSSTCRSRRPPSP